MAKLDPGSKFVSARSPATLARLSEQSVFNVAQPVDAVATATVFVRFTGDVSAIERAGMRIHSVAGDVATGEVRVDQLDALAQLDSVVRVELSRVLHHEMDLGLPEAGVPAVHAGPPGLRGAGVIIGIIDSGIDYLHSAFRRDDGTSRILAIWDQGLEPQGAETSPTGFGYGVEFGKPAIDEAIASDKPFDVVRHRDQAIRDVGCHGTHVAGIAAGDGLAAGPARTDRVFTGVAPAADLVVVANTRGRAAGELGLGDSAASLDAVRYIVRLANALGRPVVVNQSQGDNVGPHDGSSLFERGLDNLLGAPGRVMVKSAGNEGARKRHASGRLTTDESQVLTFTVPPGRRSDIVVDIWYPGIDRFSVTVAPPTGDALPGIAHGETTEHRLATGAGDRVFIDSDVDDNNLDNRIFIVISPADEDDAVVEEGTWSLTLTGTSVTSGRWDAWIQRGDPSPRFQPPFEDPSRTISIPGTGHEVITAASYANRGGAPGTLSAFSSRGPTRDGRPAPTVAAPGEFVMSVQPSQFRNAYGLMSGTSMASPMVTGIVALLLQKQPTLTQAQVSGVLAATARSDSATGATPNNTAGAGKVNAAAAVQAVPEP
ncbi:MAG TPA: S8 family peptidase [Micromonosporaceae bacterium]|nr:S8 family peptidase [Micromonosporaceae bacterium]